MSEEQPNNPLHGLTLEAILTRLVDHYTWEGMAARIRVRCFSSDPSIKSSLTFLRQTPWARTKVENLYLRTNFALAPRPMKKPPRGGRASLKSAPYGAKTAKAPYPAKAPKTSRTSAAQTTAAKAPRRETRGSKTAGPEIRDSQKQ